MPAVLKHEISVGPCREQCQRGGNRDRCPEGLRKLSDGSLHGESTLQGEKGRKVSTGRHYSPAVSLCLLTPQQDELFLPRGDWPSDNAVILPHYTARIGLTQAPVSRIVYPSGYYKAAQLCPWPPDTCWKHIRYLFSHRFRDFRRIS